MSEDTKRICDVALQIVTMIGAAIAFLIGLRQWRRGQEWQRAEQMDKFIREFENTEQLRLAALTIDWTCREVTLEKETLTITNSDSLLALRNHQDMRNDEGFEGQQARLRDAYDALLAFFTRIELALSTHFIDVAPAKQYFHYWLYHFLAFDRHPDEGKILKGKSPEQMVKGYIEAYGNPDSIRKLCKLLDVNHPLWET